MANSKTENLLAQANQISSKIQNRLAGQDTNPQTWLTAMDRWHRETQTAKSAAIQARNEHASDRIKHFALKKYKQQQQHFNAVKNRYHATHQPIQLFKDILQSSVKALEKASSQLDSKQQEQLKTLKTQLATTNQQLDDMSKQYQQLVNAQHRLTQAKHSASAPASPRKRQRIKRQNSAGKENKTMTNDTELQEMGSMGQKKRTSSAPATPQRPGSILSGSDNGTTGPEIEMENMTPTRTSASAEDAAATLSPTQAGADKENAGPGTRIELDVMPEQDKTDSKQHVNLALQKAQALAATLDRRLSRKTVRTNRRTSSPAVTQEQSNTELLKDLETTIASLSNPEITLNAQQKIVLNDLSVKLTGFGTKINLQGRRTAFNPNTPWVARQTGNPVSESSPMPSPMTPFSAPPTPAAYASVRKSGQPPLGQSQSGPVDMKTVFGFQQGNSTGQKPWWDNLPPQTPGLTRTGSPDPWADATPERTGVDRFGQRISEDTQLSAEEQAEFEAELNKPTIDVRHYEGGAKAALNAELAQIRSDSQGTVAAMAQSFNPFGAQMPAAQTPPITQDSTSAGQHRAHSSGATGSATLLGSISKASTTQQSPSSKVGSPLLDLDFPGAPQTPLVTQPDATAHISDAASLLADTDTMHTNPNAFGDWDSPLPSRPTNPPQTATTDPLVDLSEVTRTPSSKTPTTHTQTTTSTNPSTPTVSSSDPAPIPATGDLLDIAKLTTLDTSSSNTQPSNTADQNPLDAIQAEIDFIKATDKINLPGHLQQLEQNVNAFSQDIRQNPQQLTSAATRRENRVKQEKLTILKNNIDSWNQKITDLQTEVNGLGLTGDDQHVMGLQAQLESLADNIESAQTAINNAINSLPQATQSLHLVTARLNPPPTDENNAVTQKADAPIIETFDANSATTISLHNGTSYTKGLDSVTDSEQYLQFVTDEVNEQSSDIVYNHVDENDDILGKLTKRQETIIHTTYDLVENYRGVGRIELFSGTDDEVMTAMLVAKARGIKADQIVDVRESDQKINATELYDNTKSSDFYHKVPQGQGVGINQTKQSKDKAEANHQQRTLYDTILGYLDAHHALHEKQARSLLKPQHTEKAQTEHYQEFGDEAPKPRGPGTR